MTQTRHDEIVNQLDLFYTQGKIIFIGVNK